MRYILIDLSSDNYLQQPNLFGGYEGEHNETILQVKLPKRMIDIECSGYRFDFQTSEDNKISSPLIPVSELNNNILSFHLTQQLTISGKLLFNVVAILSDENTVSLISKTNTVVLHIENAADGNIQLLDPNGYKDELQKMVDERIAEINPAKVDQTYIPDSEKAQSGKAVTEAIANTVGQKTPEGGEIFNTYEDETVNEESITKNIALTRGHAEGESNIAGTKAFYVESIDVGNKAITLDSVEGLSINDEYSIHVNTSVEFAGKITAINANTVTVNELSEVLKVGDEYSNRWFWIPAKPTLGTHIIGRGTHAEGGNNIAGHIYSHAEGCDNIAGGRYSHAEGKGNKVAYAGHAEGRFNVATGLESHAEGRKTVSTSPSSHTEGNYTVARSSNAHAEGLGVYSSTDFIDVNGDTQGKAANKNYGAHGIASHSEGVHTFAKGLGAHAEGIGRDQQKQNNSEPDNGTPTNIGAIGNGSHSEGYKTYASGNYSHAEGQNTISEGQSSHSEGTNTEASAQAAHAEGQDTKASNTAAHAEGATTIASGLNSHAEGATTIASGLNSHAEGLYTIASGDDSHAEGHGQINRKVVASNIGSHAEGIRTESSGVASHSEGADTQAIGGRSHAEGNSTYASGFASHAEGSGKDKSQGSVQGTYGAFGDYSHSEGNKTIAEGQSSHTEGELTQAIGNYSHAEGYNTKANGIASHAEGYGTIAQNDFSYAGGCYNKLIETEYEALDLNTCTCNTNAGVSIENKQIKWDLSNTNLNTMRHCGFQKQFTPGVYKIELEFSTTYNSSISYDLYGLQNLDYVTTSGGKQEIGSAILNPINGKATSKLEFVIVNGYQYLDILMTSSKINTTIKLTKARIILQEDTTLHVIGNGTSNTDRNNAFAVFKDGHAELGAMGNTDNSVVTRSYANNAFANALKGNASGTTITIDDVSPVTHKMSVKISSDTVADLTAVKVTRCGKNIVPTVDSGIYYRGSAAQGKPYIPTDATVLTSTQNIDLGSGGKRGFYAVIKLTEGKTYTLSFKNLVNNCATPEFRYCVGFRTNESDLFGQSQIDNAVVSASNPTSFTFTVPSGSPYCLVGGYNYPNVAGDTISFEAMQIEVGSVATDFQDYISTTYTPNADGTVEGVTSLYPTTTLSTNTYGVIIDCEYNRDINKAFAELQQVIISLGGNV